MVLPLDPCTQYLIGFNLVEQCLVLIRVPIDLSIVRLSRPPTGDFGLFAYNLSLSVLST